MKPRQRCRCRVAMLTAPLNPIPIVFCQYSCRPVSSLIRPTSIKRVWLPKTLLSASLGFAVKPRLAAKSFPDPAGITPRRGRCPSSACISPFTISWIVPSPPTATTAQDWPQWRGVDPGASVRTQSSSYRCPFCAAATSAPPSIRARRSLPTWRAWPWSAAGFRIICILGIGVLRSGRGHRCQERMPRTGYI